MSAVAALLLSLIGTDRLGDPTPPGVMARCGTNRLCVGKGEGELRFHPTRDEVTFVPKAKPPVVTRAPRSWRKEVPDEDTDPFPLSKESSDCRRRFTIRFRVDDKADRYRGYPECFILVFDTLTNRVEARSAFRLDDIGSGGRLKPSEEGDEGYHFRDFTLSDDGKLLAWTDHLGRLRIRHLPTRRVVTAPGDGYSCCPMAFSPTGKRLAVCDRDGIIRLIDPHTGRFQLTDNPPTAAKQTAVSPDGKLVATGHACGEVWVWDAASGQPLWHTDPDGEPVREVHFNPTGTTVSAVGFWGPIGVRTWDAKTGKELGPMLPYRYFRTIAVSADGKRIADLIEEKSVMENGKWAYPLFVRTREVATGKEVGRMRLDHRLGLSNESNAVVSRDGRVMVVTHNADGGETIAYDTATGKRLCEMNPSDGALAISADGRLALSASLHKGHIWDTLIGLEIVVFESPLLGTTSLALSPCGRFLLAHFGLVPGAPVTWVFDLRSRQARLFRGQTIAAFFPDGKSILTLPRIRGAERVSLEPLAWKVAPPAKPTDARMNRLWTQLGEPAALDAVFELARHPAEAVPFLKAKLQTDPPDPKAVAAHIGRLGSRLYAEREESTKALRAFGPAVLPALRAALKDGPAPEVRRRLESLLAVLGDTATPFTLARLRAVEVLERCGTPDSRTALKTLAEKQPATPWDDAAARALLRLGQE